MKHTFGDRPRSLGFDEAAVLNGGSMTYPPARFTSRARAGRFVAKDEVCAAINDADTCLINARSSEEHIGAVTHVARPGHIRNSMNVPAAAACSDALVLTLSGVDNVAVYDGSLVEWAGDPSLPLELD